MGRAHMIHAVVQNVQVEHQPIVLEASGKLNGMVVTIFIDPGTIESFISPNSLLKCKLVEIEQNDFDQVEMASGQSQKVECLVQECPLNLGVCITNVNLYVAPLGHYDVIIEMDWLEAHSVMLSCRSKTLHFLSDEGQSTIIHGERRTISLRLISSLQMKRSLRKRCQMYVVMNLNEEEISSFEQYPFFSELSDVFLKELSGSPPKQEIDFSIELKPSIEPISKAPY